MTNLADVIETEVADTEAPAVEDGGQGEVDAATPEVTEAPVETFDEADLLDTSEIGDRMVRLTVDGEERVVPLNEALAGYNSNAAATQRFQEASQLKEEAERSRQESAQALNLAQAVTNDPGMTMQVLASQAGLTVEQFLNLTPQQQTNVAAASEPEPEFTDPLERQLYEERQARVKLEQRIEAQEQGALRQQADSALQQAVGGLQHQYGASEDDARSVVQQAYQMKVGPELFPMIYQAQQYQKSQVQSEAEGAVQAARQATDTARQTAAAQAGQAVGSGSGAVGTAPAQVVQPMTAEEAVRASLDQLGITD